MTKAYRYFSAALLVLVCSLAEAADQDPQGYLQVTGPCRLEFPRDHGAHPGYRTEWWYYTGNLVSEGRQPYGFQLTIFRSRLAPPGAATDAARPKSAWRTDQVYFGHLAISDIAGARHWQADTMARGALGLAGSQQTGDIVRIWLPAWSIQITPDAHQLTAQAPDIRIDLTAVPRKPAVLHGDEGYSKKGNNAQRASCYYSFTRMAAEGRLTIGDRSIPVRGQSWMDHEFSTAPLEPGIVGWDWFSLQLSDYTEIMFFLLRTRDGDLHPASSGTFIDAAGRSSHLEKEQLRMTVLDRWQSPTTGGAYPSRWRMQLSHLSLDLTITSRLADQEMRTSRSTGVTYWEGSVSVAGHSGGGDVDGAGYVEMTGYADAFEAPL